jgi:hypothetical protein
MEVCELAVVLIETRDSQSAWQIAEEIRVILGKRAKVVET